MGSLKLIKLNRWIALDAFFLGLLVCLIVNSLIANWTLNPYWDLIFARVHGPIFYNVHAASILFLCFVALYRVIQIRFETKETTKWIVAIFASASIHEFLLLILGFLKTGKNVGDSYNYIIELGTFLVLAAIISQPFQKRVLVYEFLILLPVFFFFNFILGVGSTIDVNGFAPAADFLNPVTNATEVLTWVLPSLLWLMPKSWMKKPLPMEDSLWSR